MFFPYITLYLYRQAYKEGKKERPPFSINPQPAVEKPEIPDDLLCNLCKDLLTDAVMVPCCGNSFCDECKLSTEPPQQYSIAIRKNIY